MWLIITILFMVIGGIMGFIMTEEISEVFIGIFVGFVIAILAMFLIGRLGGLIYSGNESHYTYVEEYNCPINITDNTAALIQYNSFTSNWKNCTVVYIDDNNCPVTKTLSMDSTLVFIYEETDSPTIIKYVPRYKSAIARAVFSESASPIYKITISKSMIVDNTIKN